MTRDRPIAAGPAIIVLGLALAPTGLASAASMGPPMLDIAKQCGAITRHNATAMSECVVAESEARSEILQKWDKISDADAERCGKISRKAKKFPYTAMANCLTPTAAPAAPAAADTRK